MYVTFYNSSRTINNDVTPFKLPTAYNLPKQDHIIDEDDKDKVHIDPKNANANDYTLVQLEDVVKGWMRYIKKLIKTNKAIVNK